MGYSISVRFPSVELKDRVFNFLDSNFRNWEELTGQSQLDAKYIEEDAGIAYGSDECPSIGFNYTSTTIGVEYAWRICTWMAKLIERFRHDCGKCHLRVECLPSEVCLLAAVNYDDCEDFPLNSFADIEEDGFFPIPQRNLKWHFFQRTNPYDFNQIVKEELQRLTALWLSQNQ